jgi:hypothetical protein
MYLGLPVLATDTGFIKDMQSNSYLIKTDFKNVKVIEEFFNSKTLLEKDKQGNKEYVSQFSMYNYVSNLVKIYNDLKAI